MQESETVERTSDEVLEQLESEQDKVPFSEEENQDVLNDGEEKVKAEESTKKAPVDMLEGTPFKTVDDLKKSYKELQSLTTPVQQENARLKEVFETISPFLDVDEDGNVIVKGKARDNEEVEDEDFEFMDSKKVERTVEEKVNSAVQNMVDKAKRQEALAEAEKLPEFDAHRDTVSNMLDMMGSVAPLDELENPYKLAYELATIPGLVEIYKEKPGLFMMDEHGGIEIAKTMLQLKAMPEVMKEIEKKAKSSAVLNQIEKEKGTVGNSSAKSTPAVAPDYSKMSLDELEKLVNKTVS